MKKLLLPSMTTIVLLLATLAQAMQPIRNPKELWEPKWELVFHVSTAKVVLADYKLIRQDFPEIAKFTNAEIDVWLVRNAAFISWQQSQQSVVNTSIQLDKDVRRAWRPKEYRRAHVFTADTGGLIDAKGTGAVDPSGGSHDNGLATLGDMIREYTYEKMVNQLFVRANTKFDTVGSYAVLDFGFDVIHPDKSTSRAGVILRQAHTRNHSEPHGQYRSRGQSQMLPRPLQLEIESFLRKWGITSSVPSLGGQLINLQGATTGAVIDFGSFLVQEKFENHVAFFYDKDGEPRPELIWSPEDPTFIQPDPKLRIPFDLWGYSVTKKMDSKYDNPFIWSHELAQALADGRASRKDAERHFNNMMSPVHTLLKPLPRTCHEMISNW